jgi:hypothetical protein
MTSENLKRKVLTDVDIFVFFVLVLTELKMLLKGFEVSISIFLAGPAGGLIVLTKGS